MTTPVDYLELIYDPLANDLWLDVCQAQRPEIAEALQTHLIALGWSGRISDEEDASCVLFVDTLLVYVLNALSRAGWVQQPPVREPLHDDLQRTLFRRTRPADVSELLGPTASINAIVETTDAHEATTHLNLGWVLLSVHDEERQPHNYRTVYVLGWSQQRGDQPVVPAARQRIDYDAVVRAGA